MRRKIINQCKTLIDKKDYKKCEQMLAHAMTGEPHSAIPHNLMGILLEKEDHHILAMKHFRAAYALDPTYIPARYNMELFANSYRSGNYAYCEEDCEAESESRFEVTYDEHHIGHFIHK